MDIKQVMTGSPQTERKAPEQNLASPPEPVSLNSAPRRRPQGFFWLIDLRILGVLAAFAFGYSYFAHQAEGLSLWYAAAALLFFAAFSAIHVLLEKKASVRIGTLLLETIAWFAPSAALLVRPSFGPVPFVLTWPWLALAGAVAFVFLAWGNFSGRSELAHGTQIRFFRITRPVVSSIVTVALLFMICWYALAAGSNGNFFLSEASFDRIFAPTSAFVNGFYPTVSLNGSFADFATSVVTQEAERTPTFAFLTSDEQSGAISENAATFTQNFSKALGVTITPTSTVSDVIYASVAGTLRGWQDRFGSWFLVAWVLVVFVILRSIAVVFIWIAQFFAMLLYELMLATGVIRIVEQPETREVVEFK